MKRLLILSFVLLFSLHSKAQEIDFGLKAGANFSTLTDASGLSNKTGFLAGAFLGVKFSDKFALQPELLYSQQGAEFNLGDFDLNYVNVPVVVKYYIVQGLNLQAGPQFGFLVDDNISDVSGNIRDSESFDLSGIIGAGYDLPLGLRIDARYHFGFTDVFDSASGKNGVFSVALGYSFL